MTVELWAQVRGQIRLAAVVQTIGEVMAIDVHQQEIHLRAGDTEEIRFTVQDDVSPGAGGPNKYPITTDHEFKFSIKYYPTLLHEILFKTSYRAGDIDLTDIAGSHVTVPIKPNDLRAALQQSYRWELEMFEAGAMAAGTGTIEADEDGTDVTGTGTAFVSELKSGDVLEFPGGYRTVIRTIEDDEHMTVDPGDWPDLVGVGFLFAPRTFNKTIAGGFVVIHNELTV